MYKKCLTRNVQCTIMRMYKVQKQQKGVIKIGNEIQNVDMRTPIEIALQIGENGHTTARALYEFLELGQGQFSRWSKTNIEKNEFYEENVDWWGFDIVPNGNNCKDYKLTTDFAKHLCMESQSSKLLNHGRFVHCSY